MSPRRRGALVLAAALLLAAVVAVPALAAAGGGSSGFGGGGGGGGRGAGISLLVQLLIRLALIGHGIGLLIGLALILAYLAFATVVPHARSAYAERASHGRASRRRTARRTRRAELAAAAAAEEDPAFAPEQITLAARALFTAIQAAWSADDRRALADRVSPGLLGEWSRRLDDFARRGWRNHVELDGTPRVALVGLQRGVGLPTATVRVEATLRDFVTDRTGRRISRAGRLTESTRIREFWTLGRTDRGWILERIERGAEGAHALSDELVATPWADETTLHDAAVLETVETTDRPGQYAPAREADPGAARAAALDLSLVDGRFAPSVVELSVRRAVTAWARAADGEDGDLRALATVAAARALLHPADPSRATRIVVRGPELEHVEITGLRPHATPPQITVAAHLRSLRYREDRATGAILEGNSTRRSRFAVLLTFALSDDPERPWQLVAAA